MRVAMMSCWDYRDAWRPFLELLKHFWPGLNRITLVIDKAPESQELDRLLEDFQNLDVYQAPHEMSENWCQVATAYANQLISEDVDGVLMLQEDFFLNSLVNEQEVLRAYLLLQKYRADAIRLYPCPGADEPLEEGERVFGKVAVKADYLVSCQASIWKPSFLKTITSEFKTPWEFEINGTQMARAMGAKVLSVFREAERPWPIEYVCTAIVRGKWLPAAKNLCDSLSIKADFSKRGFYGE